MTAVFLRMVLFVCVAGSYSSKLALETKGGYKDVFSRDSKDTHVRIIPSFHALLLKMVARYIMPGNNNTKVSFCLIQF